jgi:hypothetical protein
MGQWKRVNLPVESTGNVAVALQDQHTELVVVPMHIEENSGNLLASPTVVDSNNITLTAGHGVVVGNSICIKEGNNFYFGIVLAVVTNTITLDTPMDTSYPASAIVCIGNPNLNVNGSITPKLAHLSPSPTARWDVTRLHVRMVDNSIMDAGTFAGASILSKGLVLRKKNGVFKNIANVKTNGDLAVNSSNYSFDLKPPAGKYGFTSNHILGGQSNVGVVIRIDGNDSDELQVIIQDDLTSIEELKILAIGHVVID